MKLSKEVVQKIKQIEIHTRRLLRGTQLGDYRSAQKGTGLDFDQIREYQLGDDVRFIDWNASARSDTLLIKQYRQERNRTIMLLVDQSASTVFGSEELLKSEIIAQIASVIALVAECGKDSVGALLFADQVLKTIAPGRGRDHVHKLMEHLFISQPSGATSLRSALQTLLAAQKQSAIVFIISDFLTNDYEQLLKIAARKHEIVAIRCLDPREKTFKNCGMLSVQDPETGQSGLLQTGSQKCNLLLTEHYYATQSLLKKCGIELLDIAVDRPFIGEIIRFFRKKMVY